MAREIEGVLYRVNFYGGQRFVDCSGRDDLLDYCARQVAKGSVVLGVNEIRRDGSTPKVPVLTDKRFKQLVQEYQQEAEREAQDEPKVVRTMDELRDYLEEKGWWVNEYDDSWEVGKHSPAGEDFFFSVEHDNDVKAAVRSIKEYAYEFDVDEHVSVWAEARQCGDRKGIPSIRALVQDADEIQEMLDDLADGVNWCEMETVRESCEKGSLEEQIRACEGMSKTGEKAPVERMKDASLER